MIVVSVRVNGSVLSNYVRSFSNLSRLSSSVTLLALSSVLFTLQILTVCILQGNLVSTCQRNRLTIMEQGLCLIRRVLSLTRRLTLRLFLNSVVRDRNGLLVFVVLVVVVITRITLFLNDSSASRRFRNEIVLTLMSSLFQLRRSFSRLIKVILRLSFRRTNFLVCLSHYNLMTRDASNGRRSQLLFSNGLAFSVAKGNGLISLMLRTYVQCNGTIVISSAAYCLLLHRRLRYEGRRRSRRRVRFSCAFRCLVVCVKTLHPLLVVLCFRTTGLWRCSWVTTGACSLFRFFVEFSRGNFRTIPSTTYSYSSPYRPR